MHSPNIRVVRDLLQTFGDREFRLVTRLDRRPPPAENVSTAHCLAFRGDHVVLARHTSRDWTIPGGHLETGETAEDAVHREAREEAGITIANLELFAHEQIDPIDGIAVDPRYPVPSFQVFYVAQMTSISPIEPNEETVESRLFAPDEARDAPGWIQRNRPLFEAALSMAKQRHKSNDLA